jgi:hypothetical protein
MRIRIITEKIIIINITVASLLSVAAIFQARILTTLFILCACLSTMWLGSEIVRFRVAQERISDPTERAKSLQDWKSIGGLSISAREAKLALPIDQSGASGIEKRIEDLRDVLALRPLASEDWLFLARELFVKGKSVDKALIALNMSVLTGPNEGSIAAQRAALSISHWEVLNDDQKAHAVADLRGAVEMGDYVPQFKKNELRKVLGSLSLDVRRNIRMRLVEIYGLSDQQITSIGLQ